MTLEQVVLWVIVGAIAGLLAQAVVRGTHTGLLGTIAIGIIGALIGGWLFNMLRIGVGGGLIGDIVTAFVGAVVLLLVLRWLRRL